MDAEDRYLNERLQMVSRQIKARGITDEALLDAFRKVKRHLFVPPSKRNLAYGDFPLPIGEGQTISQPFIVALMSAELSVKKGAKVLEVGTGSGYQSAILAQMGCIVHSIERNETLAMGAVENLKEAGYLDGVKVHVGDGTLGVPDEAPFDAIIVTAGGPKVPETLKEQLIPDGGILVIPVGSSTVQDLIRVTRNDDSFETTSLGGCYFVPLIGEGGWGEDN